MILREDVQYGFDHRTDGLRTRVRLFLFSNPGIKPRELSGLETDAYQEALAGGGRPTAPLFCGNIN